eukprot:jgi/Picsp_1/3060/NSC_01282-R1_cell cycle checkpoint protein rad17
MSRHRKGRRNKNIDIVDLTNEDSQPEFIQEDWTCKYAPRTSADLQVRKPKVKEVTQFLESAAKLCIISGPAGCGKSITLKLLCQELGVEILEFASQIQVAWQDVVWLRSNTDSGTVLDVSYSSKLDAYEAFCDRAWMPSLVPKAEGQNNSGNRPAEDCRKLVILDDLPTVVGTDQMQRLIKATQILVSRSVSPTVLVITNLSSKDQTNLDLGMNRWSENSVPKALVSALDVFDPIKINFNPITQLTISKHLSKIAQKERLSLQKRDIDGLAEESDGDIRSAILNLQFLARGLSTFARNSGRPKRGRESATEEQEMGKVTRMLKDTTISLFHGLGKLLYNKRVECEETSQGQLLDGNCVAASSRHYNLENWMIRPPMDGFNPDFVVQASGLSGPSVAAFLHENVPFFIADEEIGDLANCLEYFSVSDVLASHLSRGSIDPYYGIDHPDNAQGLGDLVASMIASRGLCFWNMHPAPRKWHPLHAPTVFKVEKAVRENTGALRKSCLVNRILYGGSRDQTSYSAMASEILPYIRLLSQSGLPSVVCQQPQLWAKFWNGSVTYQEISQSWYRQDFSASGYLLGGFDQATVGTMGKNINESDSEEDVISDSDG